jgi:hypothetical protein
MALVISEIMPEYGHGSLWARRLLSLELSCRKTFTTVDTTGHAIDSG